MTTVGTVHGVPPAVPHGATPAQHTPADAPAPAGPVNVWLPTAPCTPEACAGAARGGPAAIRAVPRLAVLAVVVLVGIVLSPFVARCRAGLRDRLVSGWCRAVVRAVGVRIRIGGGPVPEGGVLVVANHISWLDIPLLAAVRPARMLAKSEVGTWPVAGRLVARGGALFIERDRIRALPATVARIAGALRAGSAVVAFPEGSTWCGRAQGRFRRAVFQAALDAGVPVQPVRLRYRADGGRTATAAAFVGDDTLGASLWRVATAHRLVADVEVLAPLTADGTTDRRGLARAAEAATTGSGTLPAPRAAGGVDPGPAHL
ncbi:lysophospholipid acyltransferase family protein [Streptomyces sp. NPDC002004]